MKIKNLFIFLILISNNYFSQIKEMIKVKEVYIPLKTYENDKIVLSDKAKNNFSYLYKMSQKKDSISYYNISYEPVNEILPIIFILKRSKENNSLTLSIKENEILDTLNIAFSDKSKSITVNKDIYFLNSLYYNKLKNSLFIDNNILDLIDFLDDDLGDYPYQFDYLLKISSNAKYRNNNFKILSAKTYTTRTQSDTQDTWNVSYKYSRNNVLLSVIKKTADGAIGFEKKLLSKKGTEYKYKIYSNVESRYEDNNEVIFDINKNTYNAIQSHFQFGKIKEEISQLKRTFYQKERMK